MEPNKPETTDTPPPAMFVGWVQQALEQLHDALLLQRHPLARELQLDRGYSTDEAAQQLRRELTAVVAYLLTSQGPLANAQWDRIYSLVHMHYVEGVTVQKAADKLNVSLRQAYRDLRHGEERVAATLWARWPRRPRQSQPDGTLSRQAEMARLETQVQYVDLRAVLERARTAVDRLAALRSVSLSITWPQGPVAVSADPSVAHQVLVGVLSHAVQSAQPGTVLLRVNSLAASVRLETTFPLRPSAPTPPQLDPVIVELAGRSGWQIAQGTDETRVKGLVRISMPLQARKSILVIDDNEGLGRLLERYLTGEACQVIQAVSGADGLKMALENAPQAIVLDVMMPGVDGWEVLQTLRNQPRTASIPVIICSVLNDPELASSLGAVRFLRKPFSQDDVLSALRESDVL